MLQRPATLKTVSESISKCDFVAATSNDEALFAAASLARDFLASFSVDDGNSDVSIRDTAGVVADFAEWLAEKIVDEPVE